MSKYRHNQLLGYVYVCISIVILLLAAQPDLCQARDVTVFAHMVNTPAAMRWALDQGANAVEMDLRFDGSTPSKFQHSDGALQPCDCSCVCPNGNACDSNSVCNKIWQLTGSHCQASSTAEDMTRALGDADVRSRLAVIYIDSKLSNSMRNFAESGANVVKLLNRNVFARGYLGQVIISGSNVVYTDYLKGALAEAQKTPQYLNKYFYTFDSEGSDYNKVWNELQQLRTDNIAYSTGITICVDTTYFDAIRSSVAKNVYAGVGIWTLDSSNSMEAYINAGATSIMTNKPYVAAALIRTKGMTIPSPGNALVAKQVPRPPVSFWDCDCNYHSGGCRISKAAPSGRACECSYKGFWTCGGKSVACPNPSSSRCIRPDDSIDSCRDGGGDCGAY